MSDTPTRPEMDARLETVEARADMKFAEVLGEMRTGFATIDGKFAALNTRLDGLERSTAGTKMTIVTTTIGAAVGIVAVLVAILAYGQTWFGIGLTNRDTIRAVVTEIIQQQTPPRTK